MTLSSIGDAVLATDIRGIITFLNPVAERLTGWPRQEALGRPCTDVFRLVHEHTRQPAVHPIVRVLQEEHVVVYLPASSRPLVPALAALNPPQSAKEGFSSWMTRR